MRLTTALILATSLALALSACGKQGNLYPPEGQEEAYTYPTTYPAPETLVPGGGIDQPAEEDAAKQHGGGTYRTTITVTGPAN